MSELSVQQQKQLNIYLKNNPSISIDKAIRSLFGEGVLLNDTNKGVSVEGTSNKNKTLTLPSGRKVLIDNDKTTYLAADGTALNEKYFESKEGKIDLRNSGRYSVKTKDGVKYYAADGTELNEKYFNAKEGIKQNIVFKTSDGRNIDLTKTMQNRLHNVEQSLKISEDENGFIGKTWSGFKNLTGVGDSSDKVRELSAQEQKLLEAFTSDSDNKEKVFLELTGEPYTSENLEKFINGDLKLKSEMALNGYIEGQEMAVDITGDIVSGVAAACVYTIAIAAAPVTGGASIAIGLAAASAAGAGIKAGVKYADAKTGGREYNTIGKDMATGAFSGVLAPVTGGLGGAIGKTVAVKVGIQAVKTVGKEAAEEVVESSIKQAVKTALVNPAGYEYVGGTALKKGLAYGAEMAADGAIGGAVDNSFRATVDGGSAKEIILAGAEGFVGGLILSPVIGGGIKVTGKAGHAVGDIIKVNNVNKEYEQALIDKMGINSYKYYTSLDEKFFNDNSTLKLLNNFVKDGFDDQLFLDFKRELTEVAKKNPQIKELLINLSDNGWNNKDILKCLREFKDIKSTTIDENMMNSILQLQKEGCNAESLIGFMKMKFDNQGLKSADLFKHYGRRYTQHADNLKNVSSNDIINELYTLIKHLEISNQKVSKEQLKEAITSIEFKKNNLSGDDEFLLKCDKEMFDELSALIDKVPLKDQETISDYLIRINDIRAKELIQNENMRFAKNKSSIESNYLEQEQPLDKIILTEAERAEYEARKDFYIRKAGDPSIKQGMGTGRGGFRAEDKYLALGLQDYERYNSTEYFALHPDETPYTLTNAKYPPVIRFLDIDASGSFYTSVTDLVEHSFPQAGGAYQANALKCCFANPLGSNEVFIVSDVIIEIHPRAEVSKAHFVKGFGKEVRYGGNSRFEVIEKGCKVIEQDFGCGQKRGISGYVILQEL